MYIYDVNIHTATQPANARRFYAQAVNVVRVESGQTVSVNAGLQHEYGATPDEAFSKIERAVEVWAQLTPSAEDGVEAGATTKAVCLTRVLDRSWSPPV